MIRNKKTAYLFGVALVAMALVPELQALADTVVSASPTPLPVPPDSVAPVAAVVPAVTLAMSDYLGQIFAYIKSFGGLTFVLKLSGIVTLIIASMKVSFLQPYWNKLGSAKVYVAPVLSFIVGIVSLVVTGPFSWAAVCAYVFSGSGATFLSQILDSIKAIPGLGDTYVSMISFFENLLGGNATKQTASSTSTSNPSAT